MNFDQRQFGLTLRLAMLAALLFQSQLVLADTIALRSGEKLEGQISNRGVVLQSPLSLRHLSILLDDTGELQRVNSIDVEFVVVGEGLDRSVIDLDALRASNFRTRRNPNSRKPYSGSAAPARNDDVHPGVPIAIGLAALGLGAFKKFGGPEIKITETTISGDEETYNGLNYGLMVGGGLMTVLGLALLNTQDKGEGDPIQVGYAWGF